MRRTLTLLLTTLVSPTASELREQTSASEMDTIASAALNRTIPPWLIALCAFAFRGPLLMMQLPANSFDANFHMSMTSHYAHLV